MFDERTGKALRVPMTFWSKYGEKIHRKKSERMYDVVSTADQNLRPCFIIYTMFVRKNHMERRRYNPCHIQLEQAYSVSIKALIISESI